jgi:hypothetical protein
MCAHFSCGVRVDQNHQGFPLAIGHGLLQVKSQVLVSSFLAEDCPMSRHDKSRLGIRAGKSVMCKLRATMRNMEVLVVM